MQLSLLLAIAVQLPAQRDTVESWRARFAEQADSVALLRWEQEGVARARADRDNPMRHLELGFLSFRLGEVTGTNRHFDDAAGEFEWATELAPDWPYPWYGLGLAELALGEHELIAIENIRQALGRDHLSKAARAFARATTADPGFGVAVIELAETALRQRQRARLDVAVAALRAATATEAGRSPPVLMARGQIERQAGEADSAWWAFSHYLEAGGDPGLGRLELARTAFWLERADTGRALYFGGATLVNGTRSRDAYRLDLQWIATADELAAFDGTPDPGLHDWLRTFWQRRDATAARAPGARVAEHYRRLFHARRHFGLASRHRFYDVSDRYRSDQRDVDDRGVIYIRHGEPQGRATFVWPDVEPNESWRYDLAEGIRLFHFAARRDVQDFRLIESLADVFGADTVLQAQAGGGVPGVLRQLFESRATLDPAYQGMGFAQASLANVIANDRARGRQAIRVGTATDSWGLHFPRGTGAMVRTYLVTDTSGAARVLAVFAVPGRYLSARAVTGGVAYPVRLRLFALPPEGPPVLLDTLRTFVAPARLADDEQLTGLVELPVPSGTFDFRMVVADGDGTAGDVVVRDALAVPHFAAGGFEVSDLVLGDATHALAWNGLSEPVSLNPLLAWRENGRMELYCEIHGLNDRYVGRLEVRGRSGGSVFRRIGRLFGGRAAAVALEWVGGGTGSPTRVRQSVDLRDLRPGEYRLVLRIEAPDGRRIEREVPFRVVGGD